MCFSEKQQNLIIYNEDAKRDFGKFQGQMDCITVINNDALSSSSLTGSSGTDRDGRVEEREMEMEYHDSSDK